MLYYAKNKTLDRKLKTENNNIKKQKQFRRVEATTTNAVWPLVLNLWDS